MTVLFFLVVMAVCSSEKFEAENILEAYSFHFAYDGDKCSFELDAQHSSPAQGKENGEGNSAQEVNFQKLSRCPFSCADRLVSGISQRQRQGVIRYCVF